MKRFMEEFEAAGFVPAALIRWELTGRKSEDVKRMLGTAHVASRKASAD
jgi:hypothetical protein